MLNAILDTGSNILGILLLNFYNVFFPLLCHFASLSWNTTGLQYYVVKIEVFLWLVQGLNGTVWSQFILTV